MMPLDTDPMTRALPTGRRAADPMPMLIQVPRVHEFGESTRTWRPEAAGRNRPAWRGASGSSRGPARPRRRLRRGVRRLVGSLLVLAAMAVTFTIGWTTRGGGYPRPPLLGSAAASRDAVGLALASGDDLRRTDDGRAEEVAEADALATGPALDAPVADAEVPVVFPGYLLPDNTREEPSHEGS